MKIKLAYKLFGAFFLILAIVVGAMIFSRYLFSLNFKNYIHQVELEKLQRLVPELQKEYRANGGWQGIRHDFRRWRQLMSMVHDFRGHPPPPPMEQVPRSGLGSPAQHVATPPEEVPPGMPPAILLMDARQQPIVGIPGPDDQKQLVAVEVDGRVVGWLGLHKREPFKSGPPAALLNRQARQLSLLGGVVIGLTAFIAFMFSRHLLRPVQRLAWGTRELTNRNFTTRIKATTRDELGQLAENFNAMAYTLENYEKMRRHWLTDISHELRTPLAVLRGEIEALQDGVHDPTPANLGSLHMEILRLSKLVDDLHQLSTIDSERLFLNKQWISPCRVLEITVESYQTRFDQRQINIELALGGFKDIRLRGDADRLGQVFINLLENDYKYVQSPGTLKITADADNHFLTFYFQDSGPGVPKDALPRLFDRLYRVDTSRNRGTGGSGLGLSICRHIVENHSGRIWAQSSPMGGLSIGIRLPLARNQNDEPR